MQLVDFYSFELIIKCNGVATRARERESGEKKENPQRAPIWWIYIAYTSPIV